MSYAFDAAEERRERAALRRSLFLANVAAMASLMRKFEDRYTAVFEKAEPQDRARLSAIVCRFDADLVALELQGWADEDDA